jgi:hypothetical protein
MGGAALEQEEGMPIEKVPGYRLVEAFTGDGPLAKGSRPTMRPALAAIEEGQCRCGVHARQGDLSGCTTAAFMKTISSWGLGLRDIVEAMETAAPVGEAKKLGV